MATHRDFPLSVGAHPARYQVDQKYRRVTDPASRFQLWFRQPTDGETLQHVLHCLPMYATGVENITHSRSLYCFLPSPISLPHSFFQNHLTNKLLAIKSLF